MAIDTLAKRNSAMRRGILMPDGTIDAADRGTLLLVYTPTAGGDHHYVLPDAATCAGQSVGAIEINDSATYNSIFTSLGGDVQGNAAGTGYTLTTVSQRASIVFVSTGVEWLILSLVLF